jgi:hypothetical protein
MLLGMEEVLPLYTHDYVFTNMERNPKRCAFVGLFAVNL